jgi:hypothetical protein
MENRKRYTLEQAQTEASRLQEKIQRGEAKNFDEAELLVEAEELIKNPEATMRGFVNSKLSDLQSVEGWEGRLQIHLKNRLAGKPDKRYLFALSQFARGDNKEEVKIVTAAYLYELEHRNEMPKIPYYNPTVLFRFALNFAKTRDDLLGAAMKKYLDSISLEEIYKNFKGAENITPDDLPRLAEEALKRLSREEESSKKVLNDAKIDLFRPAVNVKAKRLRAESFFMPVGNYNFNFDRFTPEVLNYLLTNVKEENPAIFNEVINRIDEELSRISQRNIPLDEKEFEKRLEATPYNERNYLREDYQKLVAFRRIIQSVPVLRMAYNEIIRKRQLEAAEKARAEKERQRQLGLEREQRRLRDEKNKRELAEERDKIYREELARRRKRANMECDRFLSELPQFNVDSSILGEQIIFRVQSVEIGKLDELWNPDDWEILRKSEGTVPTNLSSLARESYFLLRNQDIDYEKRMALHDDWEKIEAKLRASIKEALIKNKENIYAAINSRLSFTAENPTLNDYDEYLRTLKDVVENTKRSAEFAEEEDKRQFLQGIVDIAERKMIETLPIYEKMKAEIKEIEKRGAMMLAQEEYLRDQIERQIDYLKKIYSIGTGLGLEYVESRASQVSGNVVGSVSLGHSLRITQSLKLEMGLELDAEHDNLTLEMGDDLESIKKRMAMVNWVAPHEIAHLVDIASNVHRRLFTEENLAPMETVVNNWSGNNQDLAKEMMLSIIKEIIIDAIGYRMLKEYGSANPFDQTEAERIGAALRGYIAMMDVLENILRTHAEDEEMKSRYSAILLRMIAVGEIITEEARTNKVDKKLIKDAEREMEKLKAVFDNFNSETRFINEGQIRDIIEMCKGYFRKAEQVPPNKYQL